MFLFEYVKLSNSLLVQLINFRFFADLSTFRMGKRKLATICIFIFLTVFCIHILFNFHENPNSDHFTNIDLCPACFGDSLCPQFYHGEISLTGISRLKYLKSTKNVYTGKLLRERVILKKLAHDSEIAYIDKYICKKAQFHSSCQVKDAISVLVQNAMDTLNYRYLIELMNTSDISTDISHCSSERLLSYIKNKLFVSKDFLEVTEMELYKFGVMTYSLMLNPEAILLQAFPQAEGWPFPHYYGSCGRIVVEEYVGKTLSYFEDSSWEDRISIAYQLLLIAQTLTENASNFSLYMTDVNLDNFAVRSDGTVLLIDVESIVIVDHSKQIKDKSPYLHHSKGEFCKDCLNFSFDDLCNYDKSDHNYYAICKGLLVTGSYFSTKGFLHSIPEDIKNQTQLPLLVEECANPSKLYNRFQVLPKLLQVMKSLL